MTQSVNKTDFPIFGGCIRVGPDAIPYQERRVTKRTEGKFMNALMSILFVLALMAILPMESEGASDQLAVQATAGVN